jgi:hypothetical protein
MAQFKLLYWFGVSIEKNYGSFGGTFCSSKGYELK